VITRPQERHCAVTTSTMPGDRPPLRMEALDGISGRQATREQSQRVKAFCAPQERRFAQVAFTDLAPRRAASIVTNQVILTCF
jgi:hypothetical protein